VTARTVVVLGSTGSIGTQALDVVRRSGGRFRVVGLAGGGGDVALLARQAVEFGVDVVAVARAGAAAELADALAAAAGARSAAATVRPPTVLAGPEAVHQVAGWPCDVVLNGITGSVGLGATLAALDAGRTVALANKESLIAGGRLVLDRARPGQLVPVDSEHSALAQCLRAGRAAEVRRLLLTASGGPFRGRRREELTGVTPEQALAHPTWAMGPVITVNSATLMNKGLEVIEAHLLFGVPYQAIEVVVHPQAVVHSMVEFVDGSTIAQASPPDMRLPIAIALGWPDRMPQAAAPVAWSTAQSWQFAPLDEQAFPAVALARQAGQAGGHPTAALNAANEEAVAAFLGRRLAFPAIVDTVARVVEECPVRGDPGSLADVLQTERWARQRARTLIGSDAGSARDSAGPATAAWAVPAGSDG
jgi:1-deoxy-D-xylulose-5-phosphate reductoisomerase